jgi:hypothetical protein
MLTLRLRDLDEYTLNQLGGMARGIAEKAASGTYWECNRELLTAIGIEPMAEIQDEYYRESLNYHLGLVYAHIGNASDAAECFRLSNTLPGDGGDRVFSEHIVLAEKSAQQQEAAKKRGVPPFLIASMPRSGSASLVSTIAQSYDVPIVRFSAGRFPNYVIIPSWLQRFMTGGAVAHDHFAPSAHNMSVLKSLGIKKIAVLVRDPRPAAASFIRHMDRLQAKPSARLPEEPRIIDACLRLYVPWLERWIGVASDRASGVEVHWVTNRQIMSSMSDVVRKLAGIAGDRSFAAIREAKANFVAGDDDAWRTVMNGAAQERLWDRMTQTVKDLLDLRK